MNKNKIYAYSFLLVGLILCLFVLYTPTPNTEVEGVFNTKFALEYIAELSVDEHSVYDENQHEDARLYLKGKLEEFIGVENVFEMDYDRTTFETEEVLEYDVKNLLGVIKGKSDTGILVVAHYDSRGHIGRSGELGNSYGAADDGYGIAVLLEIARLYGDKELENTIYILMTDAEETGLYGAQKASTESFMDNVGFVINIEARGVDGPAYMFETSVNNSAVIDFYKNADLPVSYSLATAVYTVMPNSTDFTEFLAVNKNGVNFAVLSGLYYYHTPLDNYTNVTPSSIEHYGRQIMPMVEEFVMNDEYGDVDYFDAESNQIFFNVFPNIFISYSEVVGTVIHIIMFALVLAILIYMIVKKETDIRKITASAITILFTMLAVVLIGYLIGNIVAFLSKVPFNITYVRTSIGGIPTVITLVLITLYLSWLYINKTTEDGIRDTLLILGACLNLLLALLTGLVLSGASFLFLIPGISALIIFGFDRLCKKDNIKRIAYGLLMIANLLILLPIVYSLYLALTVGGLLALAIILLFYLFTLIPLFTKQLNI